MALIVALSAAVSAQRGGRGTGAEFAGPPQGPDAIPIVETVGCLTEGPNNTWTLANALEPSRSTPGFSKADDVRAAEARPLGSQQIRLVGMIEMHPDEHRGHKVLVKGLLIKDATGPRLNITSLTTVGTTCVK